MTVWSADPASSLEEAVCFMSVKCCAVKFHDAIAKCWLSHSLRGGS